MMARIWREVRGVKWRTLTLEVRPFDWEWPGACWGLFFSSLVCGPLALTWVTRWERGRE
jgi:hypothetical protein